MAIAGSATVAYRITLVGGQAQTDRTTAISGLCVSAADAVRLLREGVAVTVAGANMAEFWRLWDAENE